MTQETAQESVAFSSLQRIGLRLQTQPQCCCSQFWGPINHPPPVPAPPTHSQEPVASRVTPPLWLLQTLLELGASPDYKDSYGLTPLYHTAIVGGDPACCELLLHEHASLCCPDENGWHEIHQVRGAAHPTFVSPGAPHVPSGARREAACPTHRWGPYTCLSGGILDTVTSVLGNPVQLISWEDPGSAPLLPCPVHLLEGALGQSQPPGVSLAQLRFPPSS